MIGYQMVGTNKYDEAVTYYDALLGELGATRMMEEKGKFVAWSQADKGMEATSFCVCKPHDEKEASTGNGGMTAFSVENAKKVDDMYAKAIELGGTCEGEPGPRGAGGFYAGYCRDLDGNKFNFFCIQKAEA